ncbi:MAG: DnaD domain protein [Firmicutes bacterium]|nr:DnaD domain protein [Bacillota bacterium]
MGYRPAMPGMFAVPEALVDEHLKLARELDLKVLLWILRKGEVGGLEALAHWLGRPEGDLVDAAQFWIDKGLVTVDSGQLTVDSAEAKAAVQPAALPVPVVAVPAPDELPPIRPTATQVLTRTQEDAALRRLFREADKLLGRTIGYEGQCTLLMLHDTYGLPSEVIFMLLTHCAKLEKTNISYIMKAGAAWAEREIDTIEKAGEWIAYLENSSSLWNQLCRHAGKDIPKGKAREKYLLRWSGELGFGMDMICLAYDEMADSCSKIEFAYIDKVLEGWHAAGVKTPAGAAAAKEQFRAKQATPAPQKPGRESAPQHRPSFDLAAYERSTLQVPVFEE